MSDLHRAYDSAANHGAVSGNQAQGSSSNLGLSKSITKEKFHQLSSQGGNGSSILSSNAGGGNH